MNVESYKISGDLEEYIKEIWITEFSPRDQLPLFDTIIPNGCLNIVFNYLDDYYLIVNNIRVALPNILITGQLDGANKIEYGGNTKQIGLVVTPIGFLAIFNRSAAIYKNVLIDGSLDSWGLSEIYKGLGSEIDLKVIENYLKSNLNIKENKNIKKLSEILSIISDNENLYSVKEIAKIVGLSESGFERFFKKTTGITPKAYINIIKFNESLKNSTTVDAYYDQSHLIKSYKRYTGKTPGDLLSKTDEITLKYILNDTSFI